MSAKMANELLLAMSGNNIMSNDPNMSPFYTDVMIVKGSKPLFVSPNERLWAMDVVNNRMSINPKMPPFTMDIVHVKGFMTICVPNELARGRFLSFY